MKSFHKLTGDCNLAGVRFLFTELAVAHTMIKCANASSEKERKQGCYESALAACHAIAYYRPRIIFTAEEEATLECGLRDIETLLPRLKIEIDHLSPCLKGPICYAAPMER